MTTTLALSYVHSCTLRHYVGSGLRHTAGNGKSRRKACGYCGGQLLTESGYWTVQEWTGKGDYTLPSAAKICRSESAAETWRLNHRLGGNGEMVTRFIRATEPLTVRPAYECVICCGRVVHTVAECSRYAS